MLKINADRSICGSNEEDNKGLRWKYIASTLIKAENFIMIDKIIKQLKPLIKGKLIYLSQYGSHLYGLNTENSDLDFRGVYVPNLDDIILGKAQDEINTEIELWEVRDSNKENPIYHIEEPTTLINSWYLRKVKVDVKIFSLQKFIQLCSKADTNALDLLFSLNNNNIPQYTYSVTTRQKKEEPKSLWNNSVYVAKSYIPFWYILQHKDKLINTDRLESPITYAFKQSTKYGIKGKRLKVLQEVLECALNLWKSKCEAYVRDLVVYEPLQHLFEDEPDHLKTVCLDNKGTEDYYLYVCGVQHQFNLELDKFIKRIEEKINKEYTSQRTKDAADGNDWKALSHAIRVLLEVKQLLEDGTITFPCIENRFLLRIKQGKINREVINEFFNKQLSNILEKVKLNELGWKYDEQFWNEFILNEVKNGI